MARIRDRDTKPEIVLRRLLWARGHRYRLQYRTPSGRPDLTFPGKRICVFIDGCFWHGCPRGYRRPKSNRKFWDTKVDYNRKKDRRFTRQLRAKGWSVCRIWKCRLKKPDSVIRRVRRMLRR